MGAQACSRAAVRSAGDALLRRQKSGPAGELLGASPTRDLLLQAATWCLGTALGGYALGTSRAFEGNLIDRVLGPRNFTLAMVVFFGWILPLGNRAVAWLDGRLFGAVEG